MPHRRMFLSGLIACCLVAGFLLGGSGCSNDEEAAVDDYRSRAAEQKTCPVDEKPIDRSIVVQYADRDVFFCSQRCARAFQGDPQKYLERLPQFSAE